MLYALVIFDIGNVVVEVASDKLIHEVSQLVGEPVEHVKKVVYNDEHLVPFELGHVSATVYYKSLKKTLKLPWSYEQFVSSWNAIFKENADVTQILHRLSKHHKLIALTNTNRLHLEHIKAAFPSLSVLNDWVASCEVGLRKPDPAIYQLALERARVFARDAVYIDDRPDLVEAGRSVGIKAICFKNSRQLNEDLQALGLNL